VIRRWLAKHKITLFALLVLVGAFRFLAGRPMLGVTRLAQHPTDATFLRRGTRSLDPSRPFPSAWSLMAGWQRAAWRVASLAVVGSSAWAWFYARPSLVAAVSLAGAAGVTRWSRRRRDVATSRAFRATFRDPLASALGPVLGLDPSRPDRWLSVDPTLGELSGRLASRMRPVEVRVRSWWASRVAPVSRWGPDRVQRARWWWSSLRPVASLRGLLARPVEARPVCVEVRAGSWVPDDARRLAGQVVAGKLGLTGLAASWSAVGPEVVGRWTVAVRPPERCGLAEIRAAIDSARDHELVLGLAAGGVPFAVSLDDDSPHIACSAGSGAGKSVLAMLAAVQVLRRGGRVCILDRKGSHRWARGVPGVVYCARPADMHAALVALAREADARNSQAMDEDDGWTPDDRVLIIFEEMNATMAQLRTWWAANREKDDPKASPAVTAFQELMFMGRSAQIHLFAVAQMLTAQTCGSGSARENFGVRCLARFTRNNWMMMAPECAMPRPTKVRGRWQVVVAGQSAAVQVAFLTTAEARALASERAGVAIPTDPPSTPRLDQGCRDAASPGVAMLGEGLPEAVSLSEALDLGLVPGSRAAVAKRLERDPRAPQPVGKRGRARVYATEELARWGRASGA